jgi:hypothetical protein
MCANEMPPHPARAPRYAWAHSPPSPTRGEGEGARGGILPLIGQAPRLPALRAPLPPIRGAFA